MIGPRRAAPPTAAIRLENPGVEVAVRRHPRARRLTLRIAAGTGRLVLTVPPGVRERDCRAFLDAHAGWIASRLAALPAPVEPVPGTELPLAGATVRIAAGAGRVVRRDGDVLHVPGSGEVARARLRAWLREQARAAAAPRLAAHAGALGRAAPPLTLRDPRSRWGSCTSEGRIMLSWRLILAPPEVLDYVAAHEVAHLAEMNHGSRFWATVDALLPGWRAQRDWLRREGPGLHHVRL